MFVGFSVRGVLIGFMISCDKLRVYGLGLSVAYDLLVVRP